MDAIPLKEAFPKLYDLEVTDEMIDIIPSLGEEEAELLMSNGDMYKYAYLVAAISKGLWMGWFSPNMNMIKFYYYINKCSDQRYHKYNSTLYHNPELKWSR